MVVINREKINLLKFCESGAKVTWTYSAVVPRSYFNEGKVNFGTNTILSKKNSLKILWLPLPMFVRRKRNYRNQMWKATRKLLNAWGNGELSNREELHRNSKTEFEIAHAEPRYILTRFLN